jgi:hypothetical protein
MTVQLQAMAVGVQPLSYQWQLDKTNLAGATSRSLILANAQYSDTGAYALVVSNAAGSVTSSVANLTVFPSGAVISLTWLGGTGVSITFPSPAGLNYVLEYKNSLDDPAWTPLAPATATTSGVMVLQDTNIPTASRFYRVLRE